MNRLDHITEARLRSIEHDCANIRKCLGEIDYLRKELEKADKRNWTRVLKRQNRLNSRRYMDLL